MKRIVAHWKTRGKDYLTLHESNGTYTYEGNDCGGVLPPQANDACAIAAMEAPWGRQTGPVTVLRTDRPSLRRV